MPLVVGVDGVQRTDRLRQRREPKQAFPVGQIGAWTGMLHDRRFPAREIAQRPVADPRALEFHVGRLGATELTARALDVGAVVVGAACNLPGIADSPAVRLEARAVFRIFAGQVQRELERLARVTRELEEPKKGHALCVFPENRLPVLHHLEKIRRQPR